MMTAGTITVKDNSTAGRYTFQCSAIGSPAATSPAAPAPTSRSASGAARTRRVEPHQLAVAEHLGENAAEWRARHRRRGRHDEDHDGEDRRHRQRGGEPEQPAMPIQRVEQRRATIDSANTRPIDEPIIAITLVRCWSRVRSAASAVTAAEIARRPAARADHHRLHVRGHRRDGAADGEQRAGRRRSPACARNGRRPPRRRESAGRPGSGRRRRRPCRPGPHCRRRACRGRAPQDRQDQEEPQHAQGKDRRQRNGTARRSAGLILSMSEEAIKRAAR